LVTGATGTLGGEVLATLAAADLPVRALTRSADHAPFPDGVEAAVGDLDQPDGLADALAGVQGVFLLAGFTDMPGLLERAAAAAMERVVLLSSGAVVGGEESNAITRYNMQSEAAVRGAGLEWTILRPSGFMANALRWLPQLTAGDVVRAPFPEVAVAAIDPADIAAVVALALTDPGRAGAHYRLTGPEPLGPADQVAILADVLGRPLHFQPQPDDEARAEMSTAMPTEYVDAFFRYNADGTYDDSRVDDTVPRLLQRPARRFRQWAEAHADAFSGPE
jgi:uncharacterized protein YbjT (DUF2867 family)